MEPVCLASAAALPVAWLQGDVRAEYVRFLEEAALRPPPTLVPVAWLQGEVRDEFLRFLEESAGAAAAACPERQREEEERGCGAMPHGGDEDAGVDGHDGDGVVVDDEEEDEGFVDDGGDDGDDDASACVMEGESEEDGGVLMDMEEDDQEADAVVDLLLPHILALPAFRAREAATLPVPHEPPLGFPRRGGWMQPADEEMNELTRWNRPQFRRTV